MVFSTSFAPLLRPVFTSMAIKRLGFVDDDVAAARQPDLAVEGVVDLLLDAEALEDRLRTRVVLDARSCAREKSGRRAPASAPTP